MEVAPVSLGAASRAWAGQQVDLASAARQIDRAGTSGFTAAVSGAASRFTSAWTRHADGLGTDCQGRAEALRAATEGYLAADRVSFQDLVALGGDLTEAR